jgi:hypothetical protein
LCSFNTYLMQCSVFILMHNSTGCLIFDTGGDLWEGRLLTTSLSILNSNRLLLTAGLRQ